MTKAIVYLVGAGPGDPELLTVKALRILHAADVIFHDRLVHPQILADLPAHIERVDVGKAPRGRRVHQEQIHDLLIARARAGQTVVRLKGGDPFIFGRGGEEALALDGAGIAWEVVPGISSALAAATAAKIPLTHRGVSTALTITTGHCQGDRRPDWAALAQTPGTLVILMGMECLEEIAQSLIAAGKDARTPAAVVHRATWPDQRVVEAELGRLAKTCWMEAVTAPAVIIVGAVRDVLRGVGSNADATLDNLLGAALW